MERSANSTSAPASRQSFIARNALGLWFCGLALLGYVRFGMKMIREPVFQPGATIWAWLAGAIVLNVIGVVIIVREARKKN